MAAPSCWISAARFTVGVRLVTGMWENKKPVRVRIRFGESVSEAMSDPGGESGATNDHAIRDETHLLPWLGTIEIGSTGFRFVRIDLTEPNAELLLREVTAAFVYRNVEYLGSFHSSDEMLNRIWMTGAYTVHLNMQTYLWDGIKRDRLVWVGDLHPEVMTIVSAFGRDEVVPRSLDLIRDATPLPEFMNGISSYSMWWIVIHRDWYRAYGDLEYLRAQQPYLQGLLHLLISKTRNGREQIDGWRFLDWSTEGNQKAVDAGLQALMVMALEAGAELCDALGDRKTFEEARGVSAQARRHAAPKTDNKQAIALLALAELMSAKKANETLARGGVEGYSAFYGYYILQAKAKAGDHLGALNAIRTLLGRNAGSRSHIVLGRFRRRLAGQCGPNRRAPGGRQARCSRNLRRALLQEVADEPRAWLGLWPDLLAHRARTGSPGRGTWQQNSAHSPAARRSQFRRRHVSDASGSGQASPHAPAGRISEDRCRGAAGNPPGLLSPAVQVDSRSTMSKLIVMQGARLRSPAMRRARCSTAFRPIW